MKQCTTHYFACDCREKKVKQYLIETEHQLSLLLNIIDSFPVSVIEESINSLLGQTERFYQLLYGIDIPKK